MSSWHLKELDYQRIEGFTKFYTHGFVKPKVIAKIDGDCIIACICMVSRVTSWGWPRWIHSFLGKPREAIVSNDRLLVLTEPLQDGPWGDTGQALQLDLRNGKRLRKTRAGRAAAAGNGRFIMGLEGYDFFDSWLYDRDGKQIDQWRSYGHYIADPGGVFRVAECNRSANSRMVRLLPQGQIERGPTLLSGQVPRPVELPDGTVVIFDCGKLRAFDLTLNETVLAELPALGSAEPWRLHGKLTLTADILEVMIVEGNQNSIGSYLTHRWKFAITQG